MGDLSCAIEKSDIVAHCGNPMVPMTLRAFAEKVCAESILDDVFPTSDKAPWKSRKLARMEALPSTT